MMLAGIFCCLIGLLSVNVGAVNAADVKVGIMNVQKVLVKCTAGAKAKETFDKKIKEVESKFKKEQDALVALQGEIEKKSSIWSKEKKEEKVLEFKKMRREFQSKTEDARLEMKQLQDKELEPILKAMEKVVADYGKEHNFTMILESKSGIVYFNEAVDISDDLIKEMDKSMN